MCFICVNAIRTPLSLDRVFFLRFIVLIECRDGHENEDGGQRRTAHFKLKSLAQGLQTKTRAGVQDK